MILALLHASVGGHVEIVKKLLSYTGIEIDKSNNNGDTALMCASNEMKTDIVKLLVGNKCDVNIKNTDGYTALMCGADKGAQPSSSYLCSTKRLFQLFLATGDRILSRKLQFL